MLRIVLKPTLALVVLCVVAIGAGVVFGTTRESNRLLFIRYYDDDLQVHVFDTSLRIAHPLTRTRLDHYTARWSPDGESIAYFERSQVLMMSAQGREKRPLLGRAYSCPEPACWSPDGTELMIATDGGGGEEIFVVVDPFTGEQRALPNIPNRDVLILWSPDSTHLLARVHLGGFRVLQIIDTTRGDTLMVTNNPVLQNTEQWSPDGRYFTYVEGGEPAMREIYVGDIVTGVTRNISQNPDRVDTLPVWSPDGTRIAFASGREGGADVYVMDSDGSNQQLLHEVQSGWGFPITWIDTRLLILRVVSNARELVWVGGDTGEVQPIANNILLTPAPSVSPDGRFVIYALTNRAVGISTVEGDLLWTYHEHGPITPNGWSWSPDSRQVVYTVAEGGRFETVYIVNTDNGSYYRLNRIVNATTLWQP